MVCHKQINLILLEQFAQGTEVMILTGKAEKQ
jgi:hypothetical protein